MAPATPASAAAAPPYIAYFFIHLEPPAVLFAASVAAGKPLLAASGIGAGAEAFGEPQPKTELAALKALYAVVPVSSAPCARMPGFKPRNGVLSKSAIVLLTPQWLWHEVVRCQGSKGIDKCRK